MTIYGAANIHLGDEVLVGPFARLLAAGATRSIHIGDASNIQDSVVVDATRGPVTLGEMTILAHGSTAKSGAEIGEHGTCPGGVAHCPSFVGFNSEVDGGVIDKDAMVLHLSSGRNITSQQDVMAKTRAGHRGRPRLQAGVVVCL